MKVRLEFKNTDADGEITTSLVTAMMEIREQDYRLLYAEDLSGDGKLTKSTLTISDEGMRIIRNGELTTDFMYADNMTLSMQKAIEETNRRRSIQIEYNTKNNIVPKTIIKEIKEPATLSSKLDLIESSKQKTNKRSKKALEELINSLTKDMKEAAKNLDFEQAANLRDMILELKADLDK